MYYTVIKHSSHLRTLEKCRKHSSAARALYIFLVFSNACRVLSQCNTRLRLLYLLTIRTNNNIRGISIGDQEYKLVQYADDTIGILKDEESLKVFLDVLKSYEKVSGLKINISKSECMWIGASRNCKREVLGLKWPKRPIKCLGVYLTYDYD